MATNKESKTAKRLSSLFSLGAPDPKVHLPPSPSSSRPSHSSRNTSPVGQRRSTSHLQLSSPTRHISPTNSATPSPSLRISHAPELAGVAGNSLLLPPPLVDHSPLRTASPAGSRPGSSAGSGLGSRPASPIRPFNSPDSPLRPLTPTTEARQAKRRSWLPGRGHGDSPGTTEASHGLRAWISGAGGRIPYDLSCLVNAQPVPELWDEGGDTYVYLYPQGSGRGPSFRVDSTIYSSSDILTAIAHGEVHKKRDTTASGDKRQALVSPTRQLSLNVPISPPLSPQTDNDSSQGSRTLNDSIDEQPRETHLFLPFPLSPNLTDSQSQPSLDDLEAIVAVRNLFAFLLGQSLVATSRQPSLFSIFLMVSDLLTRFKFTNLDGSTYGEVAAVSFSRYIEELGLADVRSSREKTIEGIVLGERMRSWELYNEAFVHGVGKYEEIVKLGSPKFGDISNKTRKRLERASMDLSKRLTSAQSKLEDFEFRSLFAGSANSTTSLESKRVNFKAWKSSFLSMRKHIMAFYKERYGSWPPNARSKKNNFEEGGLNRILLKELYQDFSDLYDMLVDRTSLTSRSVDMPSHANSNGSSNREETTTHALRHILSEYDHSAPPVQPPIPFDIPRLPSLATTRSNFNTTNSKSQAKERIKKLKDDEISSAIVQSYNQDSVKHTPFLEAFMRFERKSAHGKSMDDICDLRHGQWILLYAVLQALPMVVVDAPGVRWTKGVEYFLCEVPIGSAPWHREDSRHKKSWFSIAGGSGIVSLPADVVDHGVDGIYRRSHCWEVAEKWAGHSLDFAPAEPEESGIADGEASPLPSPPILMPGEFVPRTQSPGGFNPRNSVHLGLEALPLPQGVTPSTPGGGSRPVSSYDPNKSFEAILGNSGLQTGKKKKW